MCSVFLLSDSINSFCLILFVQHFGLALFHIYCVSKVKILLEKSDWFLCGFVCLFSQVQGHVHERGKSEKVCLVTNTTSLMRSMLQIEV